MNGLWLLLLLGRWSMVTGWRELFMTVPDRSKREFVSVDARMDDLKQETRSYEMLSRDSGKNMMDESVTPSVVTPISPTALRSAMRSPTSDRNRDSEISQTDGRRTPNYFGHTARYNAPERSFSSPRPPQAAQQQQQQRQGVTWDARDTFADDRNPLGMNRI